MKTSLKISILFLLCGLNLFAQDADDLKIMKMMNDLRNEQGIKPLKFHPKLDSIADVWAREIMDSLNTFTAEEIFKSQSQNPRYLHINLHARALKVKLTRNLLIDAISENVAFSYGGFPENMAEYSFIAWKNSPRHYQGMIRDSRTHFGYSRIIRNDGRILYITVFANVIE